MSGLSAKAKPFVFNPNAGSFTPGGPSSSSPPPGFSAPHLSATPSPLPTTAVAETFDLNNGEARPLTQPSTSASDSWEELAEDSKAQSTHSIPVDATNSLAPADSSTHTTDTTNHSPSPAPTTAAENVSSSATFPDASVTALPSDDTAAVDDVTEKVDELGLDEEEAKELAEAVEEEAAVTRKPKRGRQSIENTRRARAYQHRVHRTRRRRQVRHTCRQAHTDVLSGAMQC